MSPDDIEAFLRYQPMPYLYLVLNSFYLHFFKEEKRLLLTGSKF